MKIRSHQSGRYDPLGNTYGLVRSNHSQAHQGWDLEAPLGTPIFAISDGELSSGTSPSYGNWLSLKFQHRGRTYFAFYAHLSAIQMKECSVREGAIIGLTGRTGNAAKIPEGEAHLHFEIRNVEHPGLGLPWAHRSGRGAGIWGVCLLERVVPRGAKVDPGADLRHQQG